MRRFSWKLLKESESVVVIKAEKTPGLNCVNVDFFKKGCVKRLNRGEEHWYK